MCVHLCSQDLYNVSKGCIQEEQCLNQGRITRAFAWWSASLFNVQQYGPRNQMWYFRSISQRDLPRELVSTTRFVTTRSLLIRQLLLDVRQVESPQSSPNLRKQEVAPIDAPSAERRLATAHQRRLHWSTKTYELLIHPSYKKHYDREGATLKTWEPFATADKVLSADREQPQKSESYPAPPI